MTVVEYRPWARQLRYVGPDGLGAICEVGSSRDWSPTRGRPVVYLDQNHWSTLSKAWSAPNRVRNQDERAAAAILLGLAESKRIILPMSAAHLSETGAWSNDEGRLALAKTILSLSGGWQMRDPLEVRTAELRMMLCTAFEVPCDDLPKVITLAPHAALDASKRGRGLSTTPVGIPNEWHDTYSALQSSIVYTACLLNRVPTPRGDLSAWVARVQGFSTWLVGETNRTKHQKRRAAYAFAFSDTIKELSKAAFCAGVTPEQTLAWVKQSWSNQWPFAPGVSYFREAMVDKIVAGAEWEANDLTDMMYLCTAAAYSDHVVGERRTVALLRQAKKRLGSPVGLHTSLVSLVESLSCKV